MWSAVPELPEVETVVRVIRPRLRGQIISDIFIDVPRQVVQKSPRQVRKALRKQRIKDVSRRGKQILIELESGTFGIHLGMTGTLYVRAQGTTSNPHERAKVSLENGHELVFRDSRTFGKLSFWTPEELQRALDKFGWEPLSDKVGMEDLKDRLSVRRTAIKPLLLDQSLWQES